MCRGLLAVASEVPSHGFGWLLLRKCRGVVVASQVWWLVGWLLLLWCRGCLVAAYQMPSHGFGWMLIHKCRGVVVASQVPWLVGCCFLCAGVD